MLIEVFATSAFDSESGKNDTSDYYSTKEAIKLNELTLKKNAKSFFVEETLLDGNGRIHKNKIII